MILLVVSFHGVAQPDTTIITRDSNYRDDTLIYITDTLISSSVLDRLPVLYGTVVLPETKNTRSALIHGLYLVSVSKSNCKRPKDKHERVRIENEVISIIKTDTMWVVELKIIDNCCHQFLCEISVEKSSILNFIYKGYGYAYCDCKCNYLLTYNIELDNYEFMKDNIAKIKYTMLNGDENTINEIK